MRLIGINGFKGSGKDTVYTMIRDEHPDLVVQRVAFADKLKVAAAEAFGYSSEVWDQIGLMDECKNTWEIKLNWLDGGQEQFNRFTGRQYLQWFGQGMREVFGSEFWIDQVLPSPIIHKDKDLGIEELNRMYKDADIVCITDVRYPNEAQRIKDLGGEVWEVIRPDIESDGHASETPLPYNLIDLCINNEDQLSDLRKKVRNVFYCERARANAA